ncbi:hypothetical protein H0H87_007289 [Tephrocybe sp. NHM501043]|nr:hypothetical protein H0H87_007289 [Tephrocybe sp. NHM501043]
MNRPYGAVDVAANLKGAIPKAAAQKILIALAEKRKTIFFVVNQANIDTVPSDQLAVLEAEQKAVDDENKLLSAELRTALSGISSSLYFMRAFLNFITELAKLKMAPSDQELDSQVSEAAHTVSSLSTRLGPLRSGAPLISEADLVLVDAEWTKWRVEWVRRRKVFTTFWQLATDALPPPDASNLAEDLGVELDTPEHSALERTHSSIFATTTNSLKRKR